MIKKKSGKSGKITTTQYSISVKTIKFIKNQVIDIDYKNKKKLI